MAGARNLLKVLTVIHVLIWRLPRVRVRRQARAVGLLVLSVLGALVLAQLVSKLQDRSFPAWVFATSLFMLIPAGLWLVASLRLFPHPPEVGWRDLVPGALLVGVGIEALHIFTVVYIAHSFERKSETYGAIGGSLSLLLWAYVAGRILAASPVLNAVVWRRTHAHDLPPPVVSNLPPPVVSNLPPSPAVSRASPRARGVAATGGLRRHAVRRRAAAAPSVPGLSGLPPPMPPSATANGVLPPPAAPGNGVLPPPVAAGNGRPPSPAAPARSAGAALPPPLAAPVVGPPVAASRERAAAPRPRAARMSAPAGVPVIDVGPLRTADPAPMRWRGWRGPWTPPAATRASSASPVTASIPRCSPRSTARRAGSSPCPPADKGELAMAHGGEGVAGLVPPRRRADLRPARPEGGALLRRGAAPDDPRVQAGRPLHGPNLFPAGVPELGPAVLGWMAAMTALGHLLLRGSRSASGSTQDWFERDLTREPTVLFRIFRYPPTQDEGWGVGEHTDYGLLTILAQDDRGGLQVRGRDGWIDVPPTPGVLVCNIGDMLDRMTGGPLPLDPASGPQRHRRRPPLLPVLLRPGLGGAGPARALRRRGPAGRRRHPLGRHERPRVARHLRRLPHGQGEQGLPRPGRRRPLTTLPSGQGEGQAWVKERSDSRPGDHRPHTPRAELAARSVQARAVGSMIRRTVCTMPPSYTR